MRSLILVILSAAALAGLFVFVWTLQPASSSPLKEQAAIAPPPALKNTEGYGPIKPGERIYLSQYDGKGQLASRFRGDQFLPQHDGTVRIINPEADFYLANHQHLEIRGIDGNVVMKDMPNLAQGGFANAGTLSPPARGRLNQVTVRLVDETTNTALLTMTTNNVVFDNETYRIYTEGYKDGQGNLVADDQVPVFVFGQITMRGRGMTVRWNDKDGRLELLEIAHGDVLAITDPSNLSLGGGKSAKAPVKAAATRAHGPLPEMLAAVGKVPAAQVLTHHPAPQARPQNTGEAHASRPTLPPIYRASFYDNVRINQPDAQGKGNQVLIDNVDRMDVDFLLKQSSATPPATQPAPASAPAAAASQPATAPIAATPSPATQPVAAKEPPIYVHWTGVLRITPLVSAPLVPLQPGDSTVLLTGAPVKIHRVEPKGQGTEDIRSATVLYATAGERVTLSRSDTFPQIFVDQFPGASARAKDPTHLVSSGSIQYSRAEGKTVLSGPGTAAVPLEPDAKTPHPLLYAAWARQAEFDFTPESTGRQPAITFGRFDGDVDIRHPKLAMKSQALDLLFDPPAKSAAKADAGKSSSQSTIRQIIATTAVSCDVEGADGKLQHLTGQRLVLDTDKADGKLYARHLLASGGAHAWADDDLRAGSIDVLLRPSKKKPAADAATKPADDSASAVELEKMVATGQVVARSKDGSVATGDELIVSTSDGKQRTVLSSRTDATVTDAKGNIVRGPRVEFDSTDGRAYVVGPGSLHAIQQASTTQPAQPVDVAWTGGATFDGEANHIDVHGAVHATSTDKRGYVDTATGDHIRIDLRPKPATQPVATPRNAEDASPKAPHTGANLKMDPFKGKEVASITIEKGAALASTLSAPNGDVLQQFELKGPTIHIDEFAPDGAASRRITVPAAGRMLVRDHRPQQPKTKPSDDESAGGARGATAFEWSKQLVYAEATHRADMMGDVLIVHRDDDPMSPPVSMNCEHVIAWFEPAPKDASKKANDSSPMQLRYLRAEGADVTIRRDTDVIVARQVDYDPAHHVLIATGTPRNPVTFNTGSASSGTAEEIDWDTVTWKMKASHAILDNRPPVPGAPPPPPPKKIPELPTPTGTNRR
jgi:hypothetical protein